MSTTNSVKVVFHNGQTATEPLPVLDRDEIQSMTFILGWASVVVVLSKTSPSAVEVVVHQLDQQPPPPPPPPPPPASEEKNIPEIVVQNEEINHEDNGGARPNNLPGLIPSSSLSPRATALKVAPPVHEEPEQGDFSLTISQDTRSLIMIVATLLLQMAYQAGINPPGGFWPDDLSAAAARSSAMAASSLAPAPLGGENGGDAMVPHQAGDPILRSKHRSVYLTFERLNSLSLGCSLQLILILMALPFVRSKEMSNRGVLVAMSIMCVDLIIILVAYSVVSPDNRINFLTYVAVPVAYFLAYTHTLFRRGTKGGNITNY